MKFKHHRRALYNSTWYNRTTRHILQMEIQFKQSTIENIRKEYNLSTNQIYSKLYVLDRLWITRVVNSNLNKFKSSIESRHNKKLEKFGLNHMQSDPNSVIFNLSDKILSKKEKMLLTLGLKFKLPIFKLDFYNYFMHFEYIFHQISSYIPPLSRDNFILDLKNIAHNYYNKYNPRKISSPLFTFKDLHILKQLRSDQSIIITKPDKGNGIVILNKTDYIRKMTSLLSDLTKYKPLPHINILQHIITIEDKLNRLTRPLNNPSFNHSLLHVSGSSPGIMYGAPKTHKPSTPFRPVLNAINTPSYKLSKTFVPILSPLTTNQYTVTNSHTLAHTLQNTTFNHSYLCSFDIQNLFTNIPISETIDIVISSLFSTPTTLIHGLTKTQFRKLLLATVSDSPFLFNNTLYTQTDGMPMGNPLGPTFANIFLSFHEIAWLEQCPPSFKPILYKRYIDDCLVF